MHDRDNPSWPLGYVPIFVQRPLRAAQTGGPAPSMAAAGAAAAGCEGIPPLAATADKVFRLLAWTTEPTARPSGLPFTLWTTDAANFFLVFLFYLCRFGSLPFAIFLKETESEQHQPDR